MLHLVRERSARADHPRCLRFGVVLTRDRNADRADTHDTGETKRGVVALDVGAPERNEERVGLLDARLRLRVGRTEGAVADLVHELLLGLRRAEARLDVVALRRNDRTRETRKGLRNGHG